MNPVVTPIVSGDAFYSGSVLFIASVLLGWGAKTFFRLVSSLAVIFGFILIAFSATPLPVWFYVVWGTLVGLWLVLRKLAQSRRPNTSRIFAVALVVVTIIACGLNASYMRTPYIPLEQGRRIYVVGDSLSAHYTQTLPWPDRLAKEHHLDIVNLAQPGVTLASAMSQVSRIDSTNSVVILLIGGNDLLGSTTSTQFETDLNRLLTETKHRSTVVVMFELPLPPFGNRFGQIQRALCRQFGVDLIPKRRLAWIIGSAEATSDGLHLADSGHREMAEMLWRMSGQ